MKVSVAVPCYEYNGNGVRYLSDLFRTIQNQTLKDVEVVISDQSIDDEIMDFCMDNIFDLDIKYIRNKEGRGNAAINTNVAMDNCKGEVVKLMYMDDFFVLPTALERTYKYLMATDKMWLACGTIHTGDDGKTFDTTLIPRWNDNMLKARGNNTMSGTTVISYKREGMNVKWDPKTFGLLDIDFYHSMRAKYGDCLIMGEVHVCQRINPGNIISTKTEEEIQKEFSYCRAKHGIKL